MKKLKIIFDIDSVLASRSCGPSSFDKLYANTSGDFVIAYETIHYLFPGVIEIMQYLFANPNVEIAFFSSGDEKRNREFVEALLLKALGVDKYESIKEEVQANIFSKPHLIARECYDNTSNCGKFGGQLKKDIRTVINPQFNPRKSMLDCRIDDYHYNEDLLRAVCGVINQSIESTTNDPQLKNVIIVDDDSSYILQTQCKKYIKLHPGRIFHPDRRAQNFFDVGETCFEECNMIFYLTGILAKCLELLDKNENIDNFLYAKQYRNGELERWFVYTDPKRQSFFDDGLAILQKLNPNLQFVTQKYYNWVIQSASKESENENEISELIQSLIDYKWQS
ncbi:MAG: hypothetical protein HKM04_10270 [Legionellales bacterium]|nr:hypothetical protein [Legionellales bacterium]